MPEPSEPRKVFQNVQLGERVYSVCYTYDDEGVHLCVVGYSGRLPTHAADVEWKYADEKDPL